MKQVPKNTVNRLQAIFHCNKRIADYRIGLLSKRERQIACGLAFGMTLNKIARGMRIKHKTAKDVASKIYALLGSETEPIPSWGVAQLWFMANWTRTNSRSGPAEVPEWVAKHIREYERLLQMDRIAEVYIDGGVVKKNPSEIGGTWACVFVNSAKEEISHHSGFVTPAEIGMPTVTNSVTELLAAIEALQRLPDLWSGAIFTDSFVTLCRLTVAKPKMNGVPQELQDRLARNLGRLGKLEVCLLDGHPTKAQLKRGIGKRGNKVSRWNVLADELCGLEAENAAPLDPSQTVATLEDQQQLQAVITNCPSQMSAAALESGATEEKLPNGQCGCGGKIRPDGKCQDCEESWRATQ